MCAASHGELDPKRLKAKNKYLLDNQPITKIWIQTVPIYGVDRQEDCDGTLYNRTTYALKNITFVELAPLTSNSSQSLFSKEPMIIDTSAAIPDEKLKELNQSLPVSKILYDVHIPPVVEEIVKDIENLNTKKEII